MAKPQARRIPSDDCVVEVDGEKYNVHEGEWVELIPVTTVSDLAVLQKARDLETVAAAAKGDPDENVKMLDATSGMVDSICEMLAPRVKAWNWTDDAGRPLPQPDGTAEPLKRLHWEELLYLTQAAQGQNPGPKGNSSKR